MLKLVVIGTVLAAVSAIQLHPVRQEVVDQIKALATTWSPAEPTENPLFGKALHEVIGLLGTKNEERAPADAGFTEGVTVFGAPTSYDPRTDADRAHCIHPILDQARCGSCWAFGATEALSDRYCWSLDLDVVLSPQDMVSCEGFPQQGCSGGILYFAWNYLKNTGVVTEDCFPYAS
jgi:hypothetical protein